MDVSSELEAAVAALEARAPERVLWDAQMHLLQGELPEHYRLWLLARLNRMLIDREPADKVFGLKRNRGAQSLPLADTTRRLRAIAFEQLRHGYSESEAAVAVAMQRNENSDESAARKFTRKHRAELARIRVEIYRLCRGRFQGRPLHPPE